MAEFTENARRVIEKSRTVALSMGHSFVGTEHLLISLSENKGVASKVLRENGVSSLKLREIISDLVDTGSGLMVAEKGTFTPRVTRIIDNALAAAMKYGAVSAGTEHLLLALINENDCIAVRLLITMGINIQKLYVDLVTATGQDISTAKNSYMNAKKGQQGRSKTPVLDQYSRDLTGLASEGKLDPVAGRDDCMERIVEILCRRTKNNPCLIGEPGVGKTAVVEGLAQRIAEGQVPEIIKDKRIVTLDVSGMVAGSKYRGEFEERIKRALNEVKTAGNIILFIDEIHTIIGAGGAEGAIDAANILKPGLARGEIQLIGATTTEEYRKHIEKDTALERRFQPVTVEEPSVEVAVEMLKGLAPAYEEHHKVKISNAALIAAARMTSRYVNDRFLPDKAIDALDEACSRKVLHRKVQPELARLEDEFSRMSLRKENAIQDGDYDTAGKIKKIQLSIKSDIAKLKDRENSDNEDYAVGEDDVAYVVCEWTGIPVQKLKEGESERLKHLEDVLHQRVVGQDEAVKAVARAIRRGRTGLKDPNRPIGSFLFLGPTGVGKTELSKTLAEAVFGNENDIIRVDMSEYMEKQSVSKMIGSPPGYVGYDEGGQLSEKVRKHPYSVVLFDEIEKAHPDVFNILLQILDDGHITDSQGRRVSFKDTIIIMTSNAGAQRIVAPKHLGFGTSEDKDADYLQMKDAVMDEVKNIFKPEFINRIDEIIVFHMLSQEDIEKIVKIMLNSLAKRIEKEPGIILTWTEAAVKHLAKNGFDKNYGARPIRRAIQTEAMDGLAERIIDGTCTPGSKVELDVKEKENDEHGSASDTDKDNKEIVFNFL
ncbi:MAG: ATP-dependent Clp protease ATP-binding subunit [Lachnospiraceae bacterium]|jgi:ATP-dependent Clp protease ATP-binding subunit ClpC|nr:ATP-dependent Clp protease ATP-binding subunit [Lachnospiraceae bacterium]MEE3460781.1 ATP-dependent Clp protease ATP-binding subunit [Lachnospiraceae bacterium]